MALNPPDALDVATLESSHLGYDQKRDADLWALYQGGKLFDPKRFIIKRRKEGQSLYNERLKRAYYIGYLGEIVDQFVGNLFQDEPVITYNTKPATGWWEEFEKNVDQAGSDINAYFQDRWERRLVQGSSYTWVELPRRNGERAEDDISIADLDDDGARNAYLVPLNSDQIKDFERDKRGGFSRIVIHQAYNERPDWTKADRSVRHVWTVMDEEEYAVYEAVEKLAAGTYKAKHRTDFLRKTATLKDKGVHLFGTVPVVEHTLPAALRMGEKLEGPQKQIVELDNAIAWQQYNGLFAMPVVKTDDKFEQGMGEAHYIKLKQNDDFTWAEPACTAISTSMDNRASLVEEMFRVSHQMAAAVKSSAVNSARSGESKKRDQVPAIVILKYFGDVARDDYEAVLKMVAKVRQEEKSIDPEITGFDEFDIEDLSAFLSNETRIQMLQIHSETWNKHRQKTVVDRIDPDMPVDVRKQVHEEIDAATILMPGDELDHDDRGFGGEPDDKKKPNDDKKKNDKSKGPKDNDK